METEFDLEYREQFTIYYNYEKSHKDRVYYEDTAGITTDRLHGNSNSKSDT